MMSIGKNTQITTATTTTVTTTAAMISVSHESSAVLMPYKYYDRLICMPILYPYVTTRYHNNIIITDLLIGQVVFSLPSSESNVTGTDKFPIELSDSIS